ncbi:MAG: HEPN domain-containing protein [Pseudomonadales bacterium]
MKTSLDHLSEHIQDEIRCVAEIIQEEAEPGMTILFGSYARGNWVDEHYEEDGILHHVQSDFDLLVITDTTQQAIKIERNNNLQKRLEKEIHTPVNLIAHDIGFVNKRLRKAQYFFSEIEKEGIVLFNMSQFELAEAIELSPKERKKLAEEDFEGWFTGAIDFYEGFEFYMEKEKNSKAAFLLHQSTEFLYNTFLLVFTRFIPNTHVLRKLRKRVNSIEPKFLNVFPQCTEQEKQCFDLLNEAYVRGRYKPSYSITKEQLSWLAERVRYLQQLTETLCKEKIADFESEPMTKGITKTDKML